MHLSELFCMINCNNNRQLERAGFYIYSLHKYFIAFNKLLNANIFVILFMFKTNMSKILKVKD